MTESLPVPAIMRPFLRFAKLEAAGGILLLACTVGALVWANSPWSIYYERFGHAHALVGFENHVLAESLHFWINDGLMAFFFFLVGVCGAALIVYLWAWEGPPELRHTLGVRLTGTGLGLALAVTGYTYPLVRYLQRQAGEQPVGGGRAVRRQPPQAERQA